MPQDPVKKSEAADSRRTRQERQVAAATDPVVDRIVAKLYTEEPDPFIAHEDCE